METKTGIELITEERQRQIEIEGWTSINDDSHSFGELSVAAACYAVNELPGPQVDVIDKDSKLDAWPWADKWDKREKHNRLRSLIISGALIAAEIDRIQRL